MQVIGRIGCRFRGVRIGRVHGVRIPFDVTRSRSGPASNHSSMPPKMAQPCVFALILEAREDIVTLIRALAGLATMQVDEVGRPPPPPRLVDARRVPTEYHPQADPSQNGTLLPPSLKPQIQTLLHHYLDVLEGIPDHEHRTSDDLLALMCPAWNSPAYQQLERLLRAMPAGLRQAIRVRYERYTERRVAFCRRCGAHPAQKVGNVHRHPPGRAVTLAPKMVRVLPRDDDPKRVESALEWLARHWAGEIVLPKAIEQIESERKLEAA